MPTGVRIRPGPPRVFGLNKYFDNFHISVVYIYIRYVIIDLMINIEEKIINLYLNDKLSVQQIADFLGITIFKVRYILDKRDIQRRNLSQAIKYLNITKFKKGTFKVKDNLDIRQEKLRIAGAMIYWGEGTKFGNSVVLSNSDPGIVKLFLQFLREICGIAENRLRIVLHYYPDQKEEELIRYWMKITKIPRSQFSKSFQHQKLSGSYRRISQFGTVSLRYSDKELLGIINSWIREYSKSL